MATPVVGFALGLLTAGVAYCAVALSLPPLTAGFLAVGAHALATRGMHIDGLSDTVDGLGCYGGPERAREVMKTGGAGPFGVAAVVIVLGLQATAVGSAAAEHHLAPIVAAVVLGRVAVVIACRRGVEPATDSGFGALVAGTVPPLPIIGWVLAAVALTSAATARVAADRWWFGAAVAVIVLGLGVPLVRHCVRRFAGMVGDVLGAVIEVTTALALVALLAT